MSAYISVGVPMRCVLLTGPEAGFYAAEASKLVSSFTQTRLSTCRVTFVRSRLLISWEGDSSRGARQ
jgi:hypothetical protein